MLEEAAVAYLRYFPGGTEISDGESQDRRLPAESRNEFILNALPQCPTAPERVTAMSNRS